MNDNLIAEIVAAYSTPSLKPIRRTFTLHEKDVDYLCPLVALAIHRGVVDRADPGIEIDGGANTALDWAAMTFGEDWMVGFLDGFDEVEQAKHDPDYLDGHELGVKAAHQLLPHDPPD